MARWRNTYRSDSSTVAGQVTQLWEFRLPNCYRSETVQLRRWTWTGDFKCREVKTGFCLNRSMQTGSSGTLIGWKSGQTTFVPLWDWMEGAWLRTLIFTDVAPFLSVNVRCFLTFHVFKGTLVQEFLVWGVVSLMKENTKLLHFEASFQWGEGEYKWSQLRRMALGRWCSLILWSTYKFREWIRVVLQIKLVKNYSDYISSNRTENPKINIRTDWYLMHRSTNHIGNMVLQVRKLEKGGVSLSLLKPWLRRKPQVRVLPF